MHPQRDVKFAKLLNAPAEYSIGQILLNLCAYSTSPAGPHSASDGGRSGGGQEQRRRGCRSSSHRQQRRTGTSGGRSSRGGRGGGGQDAEGAQQPLREDPQEDAR